MSTTNVSSPRRTRTRSPAWTGLAGLAGAPLQSILPPSIACLASERVLKKRAAQSQISSRTDGAAAGADAFGAAVIGNGFAERFLRCAGRFSEHKWHQWLESRVSGRIYRVCSAASRLSPRTNDR